MKAPLTFNRSCPVLRESLYIVSWSSFLFNYIYSSLFPLPRMLVSCPWALSLSASFYGSLSQPMLAKDYFSVFTYVITIVSVTGLAYFLLLWSACLVHPCTHLLCAGFLFVVWIRADNLSKFLSTFSILIHLFVALWWSFQAIVPRAVLGGAVAFYWER